MGLATRAGFLIADQRAPSGVDTDLEENAPWDRELSARLYGGDRETRIQQEIILGVGGVRALRALGCHPSVFHLNEGARAMWGGIWPGQSENDRPVSSVTNGVHVPTWIALDLARLLAKHLGDDWLGLCHGRPAVVDGRARCPDLRGRLARDRAGLSLGAIP